MSDRLKFERFLWFHERIKAGHHPNAKDIAAQFELSSRTAQRDIEFMCDRLKAPLSYDYKRKGYKYTNNTYELPAGWFSEENIMALALAARLASTIPSGMIKRNLCRFIDSVLHTYNASGGACFEGLEDRISVKNIEYSRVDERCFHEIVLALFKGTGIGITYESPHTSEISVRRILPLHLMHYMGSWYLLAFCFERHALRHFALSRIRAISYTVDAAKPPERIPSIKEYTRKHFGIMAGGKTSEVRIVFSSRVAAWVDEQVWHPRQEKKWCADGSLILKLPVADLREIKRRILAYGADAKVLSPRGLMKEMKEEIAKMSRRY